MSNSLAPVNRWIYLFTCFISLSVLSLSLFSCLTPISKHKEASFHPMPYITANNVYLYCPCWMKKYIHLWSWSYKHKHSLLPAVHDFLQLSYVFCEVFGAGGMQNPLCMIHTFFFQCVCHTVPAQSNVTGMTDALLGMLAERKWNVWRRAEWALNATPRSYLVSEELLPL